VKEKRIFLLLSNVMCILLSCAQHEGIQSSSLLPLVDNVTPQPLLAQALRLNEALSFLGSSLSKEDANHLRQLKDKPLSDETSKMIQSILDPYCLAMVDINPETRVKVMRGPANAKLIQDGWTSFLIKVHNGAGVTAEVQVESANAAPALHVSSSQARALEKNRLTEGQVTNRFLEMQMYTGRPLMRNLSGLNLEYAVVQIYSKDAGQREVEMGFNIGQGTQDIGFRNTISILFNIRRAVKVVFRVKDDDGSPTMASFTITDGVERFPFDSNTDYRLAMAERNYTNVVIGGKQIPSKELTGIYPLPSRRIASVDEYPDFFFQSQVYRSDGEHVLLPPGKYNVSFTRGPEYITQSRELAIPEGVDSMEQVFHLKRWINLSQLGWYSADHHVHAAGCSHYESPEEGVKPPDMWRQILGEDLNVAAVLSWGPGWYHQKEFFTGKEDPLSTGKNIMRYDVEVSGFPSSHAGHIVLLRLREDDYPGTKQIEDWPSWTLPVLSWAKSQGAITGYAHSGWGLAPLQPARDLPNDVIPKMDGIGANEYIVTVTQNVVDFFSAGDTPPQWELNMWYHTLNCGFRSRLSAETDFPCIFDERVGIARSYFKTDRPLNYDAYVSAIKEGRCYVSDGSSHIIDFSVNGLQAGTKNSELPLSAAQTVKITAKAAAFLPQSQTEEGASIAHRAQDQQPYWNIERARVGTTRKVFVELIVNGVSTDTAELVADGKWQNINFEYPIKQSSWIALRIYPSSHTNPVFVTVDGKPIHIRKSAQWCRESVDQCWKMKQANIRPEERSDAEAAYNKAREVYDNMIKQSADK
jgi:hypothetical protein